MAAGLPLGRLPVFGREGQRRLFGRAVQHTGEIDPADPVADIIVFGMAATPSPPSIGAVRLEAGRLVGATRVRVSAAPP